MIQHIVALRAEDQFGLVVQGLRLLEDDVCIDESRSIKFVSMDRDALTKGRIVKGRQPSAQRPAEATLMHAAAGLSAASGFTVCKAAESSKGL